ncbi:lipase 1-like isoform X2 [Harmonia axyridis]|uniref:lipase 1-like isoform X2 n=1 Tax=Harmonia axyridis TaxID=115357 RepID=UPI001E2781CC|nr:lipase 1-like isoform X2 [Harmonia axyridis]
MFNKWNFFLLFIICISIAWFKLCSDKKIGYEKHNIDQMLEKHGYPVEIHEISTKDGYLLTLFRVPHGKNDTEVNPKPILMMHGLAGTAYNFVFTEYFNVSMAGYFADRGYDVWLGNTRGTTYGRKHIHLDPNKTKFWKFSWHEIGLYDLSSIVDYILNVTRRNNLYYVGHSQGGTIFYVLTSLRPEYQKKFAQVSLMAPGGLMGHFNNSLMLSLSKRHKMLYKMAENANLFEIPPPWMSLSEFTYKICIGTIMQSFCEAVFFIINGRSEDIDVKLFPMLLNTLTSVATMQLLHYAQNIDSVKFRQWDYGTEKNIEVYGLPEPPDYPVENIKIPVTIYYGYGDTVAFAGDQEDMCRRLRNCTKYMMPNPKWNHLDFLLSKNMEKELFEPLMEYMETFKIS